MIIPNGYSEVCLDGLVDFSGVDLFFKSLMESVPIRTREQVKRVSRPIHMSDSRIIRARQGYDV